MNRDTMGEAPTGHISRRGRRALVVIALAVILIVASSVAYLHSALMSTTKRPPPATNPLLVTRDAVHFTFISPLVGWALDFSESQPQPVAGKFWILRTVDGGRQWQTQLTGENGDGGITWRRLQLPTDSVAYQDLAHWWAINGRVLLKSSDAGQTWTQVADNLPDGQSVPHVLDSKHAWSLMVVVGGYGLAFTNDGGLNWTRVNVPQPA